MRELSSPAVIDAAYQWLCQQRQHYPVNADVWSLRFRWAKSKPRLIQLLRSNQYQFSANKACRSQGKTLHLTCAQDALVLKALAIVLGPSWPISPRCTHLKGHGGLKAALRWVRKRMKQHRFVLRTDVKAYYDSIAHEPLLKMLDEWVSEPDVRRLLCQAVQRSVEWGGHYRDIHRGIGRGSPMSPLFGAIYLKALDDALDKAGLHYVRYMDDILVLTPTRRRLRLAARLVNHNLASLKLHKHPDKTWMGPINRGFDFLGYHHTPEGCKPSASTVNRFHARLSRLYEQGASAARIGEYEKRWHRWVCSGLPGDWVLV